MIGIRIAELRKSHGMSQKALGDKLHVTQGAVSQWENERTLPDTQQQRAIASTNNVLMDGRAIGTVVLPNAQVKIFLTASPEARAARRAAELAAKGQPADYETVLADIRRRDDQDTHRAAAPLRQAEDAVLADTSELDFEQSFQLLRSIIREKAGV